jgi:hypothetical protein
MSPPALSRILRDGLPYLLAFSTVPIEEIFSDQGFFSDPDSSLTNRRVRGPSIPEKGVPVCGTYWPGAPLSWSRPDAITIRSHDRGVSVDANGSCMPMASSAITARGDYRVTTLRGESCVQRIASLCPKRWLVVGRQPSNRVANPYTQVNALCPKEAKWAKCQG